MLVLSERGIGYLTIVYKSEVIKTVDLLAAQQSLSYLALRSRWRGGSPTKTRKLQCKHLYVDSHGVQEFRIATNQMNSLTPTSNGQENVVEETPSATFGDLTTNIAPSGVTAAPLSSKSLSSMMNPASTNLSPSINTFLERPEVVWAQNLTTGDDMSTFPMTIIPQDVIEASSMRLAKLSGVGYFRATSVFTFVVNANKFQFGRYILAHVPTGGVSNNNAVDWYKTHRFTLLQISQLPHVEIDISCETQVTLRIPHVSVEYNYSLLGGNGTGNVGRVIVVPYVKLAAEAAGSTVCSSTLYHHFEDIETSVPVVPQSSNLKLNANKKPTPQAKEQSVWGDKSVSRALNSLVTTTNILGEIPMLKPFTGTAAWLLSALAGTAASFGFSRPILTTPQQHMKKNIIRGLGNYDIEDTSQNIGFSYDNETTMVDGIFGTGVDEMSFEYLKSIKTYWKTVTWSGSSASGTEITSIPIAMELFYRAHTDAGVTTLNFSTIAYISKFFRYWRGSIVLTVKIVKSSFHSGRMVVSWNPNDSRATAGSQTLANTNYLNKMIIDIREGNEFEIVVPYSAYASWSDGDDVLGAIRMHVLDRLNSPTSVTTDISLIIEVSGGKDLQYAVPSLFSYVPYIPTAPQCGVLDLAASCVAVPQSGDWNSMECDLYKGTIGTSKVVTTLDHAASCIGEHVNSFRTLAKIPSMIAYTSSFDPIEVSMKFFPFVWNCNTNAASALVKSLRVADFYAHMASIYMFSTGSVRLKLLRMDDGTGVTSDETFAWLGEDVDQSTLSPYTDAVTLTPANIRCLPVTYSHDIEGGNEWQVPHFGRTYARNNAEFRAGNGSAVTLTDFHGPTSVLYVYKHARTESSYVVFRSIGDDGSFGGFVSIPPYTIA